MGTRIVTEALQTFLTNTILSASSSPENSLEGIKSVDLVDRAMVWVEETESVYHWYSDSTLTPDNDSVVRPSDISGANPGRWKKVSTTQTSGTPVGGATVFIFGATATTTISVAGSAVHLEGDWAGVASDGTFTYDAGNERLNYVLGDSVIQVEVVTTFTLNVAIGAGQRFRVFPSLNGAEIGTVGPEVMHVVEAAGQISGTYIARLNMSPGNYLEWLVVNLDDTSDVSTPNNAFTFNATITPLNI